MAVRIKSKRQVDALCQLAKDAIYRDSETPTLYLRVRVTGSAQWTQIVHIEGKRVERGLGGFPLVSIEEARDAAFANRRALRRGENPFEKRHQAELQAPTFADALEAVLAIQRGAWRNPKTEADWRNTLRRYAMPTLGSMAVDAIQRADVVDVLRPIWTAKPAAAKQVKRRISAVMDWAINEEYRKDNPVATVAASLPKAGKVDSKHHEALPFAEVPAAIATIRQCNANPAAKMAFEFLVLTAARSGEVREATWDEIDFDKDLWRIPAGRMKAKVEHSVPLSVASVDVLLKADKRYGGEGLIFPAATGKPLYDYQISNMVSANGIKAVPHGFRSSFRDWAAEHDWQDDIAEVALAHKDDNAVKAAYKRTRYLDKRREMMAQWAKFCLPED